MKLELVSVATDTYPLDGIFYQPEGGPARAGALIMHGNQGNFYSGPPRFLPPALAELGIATLAFNRRGHDILGTHLGRAPVGGALQLTEEAIADNRYAAAFLADRGLPAPLLIGHSNGGLLAGQHAADHPQTPGLVLLSAAGGGLGSTELTSRAGLLLGERYSELVGEAERLVQAGLGGQLMVIPGWWWVISAASLWDRLHHLPDLVEVAPRVTAPSFFLKGAAEPESVYPARAFARACAGGCEVVELEDCDHWYRGRELEVSAQVVGWLKRLLAGPPRGGR
ncbi:MAG TPA: alpha/beta fold hydrolase [Candidatus Acidoferrales bacterium]|nr:alpha/beta fold hydrolase [Candidatus Acidoferrales bacterium]